MITKKFISKVHLYFDELNYRPVDKLDFYEFLSCAIETLCHTESLEDSGLLFECFRFCLNKWDKIRLIFEKKLHLFNELDYVGNQVIRTISDEDAIGVYYITNLFSKNFKDLLIASYSLDENILIDNFLNNKLIIHENSPYYIKIDNSSKVLIYNKDDEIICELKYQNFYFCIEQNKTKYGLVNYDEYVGIFPLEYINQFEDIYSIDEEKSIANIFIGIPSFEYNGCYIKIDLYEDDFDLILTISLACFILMVKKIESINQLKRYAVFKNIIS